MADAEQEVQQEADVPEFLEDLSDLVKGATSGFRRDVAKLVEALPQGGLFVPLARSVPGVEEGKPTEAPDGVSLSPHLLPDRDGTFFVALFTDSDVLTSVGDYLEWSTDGSDELQYCTLPALVALDLALQLVDGKEVLGAVINPSDEHELMLSKHELGSLSQRQPLPLVGYVSKLPVTEDEKVLVAELAEPPEPSLLATIEKCLQGVSGVDGYRLEQTFNSERDLEPHPTLTVSVTNPEAFDPDKLGAELASQLEGQLPEPGYIDVLFDMGVAKSE